MLKIEIDQSCRLPSALFFFFPLSLTFPLFFAFLFVLSFFILFSLFLFRFADLALSTNACSKSAMDFHSVMRFDEEEISFVEILFINFSTI